jgi:hypothetical protein
MKKTLFAIVVISAITVLFLISSCRKQQDGPAPLASPPTLNPTQAAQATQTALANIPPATQTAQMAETETVVAGYTPTPTPMPALVADDCDHIDGKNLLGGNWQTYDDRYSGGSSTVWPPAFDAGNFVMSQPGYGGVGYAVKITGNVTTGGFISVGTMLTGTTCAVLDLSGYAGVQFYMKGNISQCNLVMPYINTSCARGDAYGSYQSLFSVPTDWAQVKIPFSSMSRPYTGGDDPTIQMLLQRATELQWSTATSPIPNAEFWIDQLEFYK